jgi:hypothetical protein
MPVVTRVAVAAARMRKHLERPQEQLGTGAVLVDPRFQIFPIHVLCSGKPGS